MEQPALASQSWAPPRTRLQVSNTPDPTPPTLSSLCALPDTQFDTADDTDLDEKERDGDNADDDDGGGNGVGVWVPGMQGQASPGGGGPHTVGGHPQHGGQAGGRSNGAVRGLHHGHIAARVHGCLGRVLNVLQGVCTTVVS